MDRGLMSPGLVASLISSTVTIRFCGISSLDGRSCAKKDLLDTADKMQAANAAIIACRTVITEPSAGSRRLLFHSSIVLNYQAFRNGVILAQTAFSAKDKFSSDFSINLEAFQKGFGALCDLLQNRYDMG